MTVDVVTIDGDVEVGISGNMAVIEEEENDQAESRWFVAFGDEAEV